MIILDIIVTLIAFIMVSSITERVLESTIENKLLDNYFIGKNSEGRYYIFGKKWWVQGTPAELKNKTFSTEELAEGALKVFIREQLREKEADAFSKKFTTNDERDAMQQEMIQARFAEVLAMQHKLREERLEQLQESRREMEGKLPSPAKAKELIDASVKRGKIRA
jgi:hypothetical protein